MADKMNGRAGCGDPDAAESFAEADWRTTKSEATYTPTREREQVVNLWGDLIRAQADFGTDGILIRYDVPAAVTPLCGLARIRSNGIWFEPDQDGVPAVITPVLDFGGLVDLVAFQPHRPASFKIRTGAAPFLGGDCMAGDVGPLQIWRHPLNWLRSGCTGVVILSWATARPLLACCGEIIAEDVPHGQEVRKLLRMPSPFPKISVPIHGGAA